MIWQELNGEERLKVKQQYFNIRNNLLKLKGNRMKYTKEDYDKLAKELQDKYNNIEIDYQCDYCSKIFRLPFAKVKDLMNDKTNLIFCSVKCSGIYYGIKSHSNKTDKEELNRRQKISETLKQKENYLTHEQHVACGKATWKNIDKEQRSKVLKERAIIAKQTKLKKYNNSNYNNIKKIKQTCKEKYGVSCALQSTQSIKAKQLVQKEINKKISKNKLKQFSNKEYKQNVINKMEQTSLERFGVRNYVFTDEYIASHEVVSKLNKKIAEKLNINEFEKTIKDYRYDLCLNKTVLDIDPVISHNINKSYSFIVGLSNKNKPIDIMYHYNRTKNALDNHYNCIHIFDWDDIDKIKYLIEDKQKLYARDFSIKEIDNIKAEDFLDKYSLTNIKGSSIYLGLFKDNILYQLISIGKHIRSSKWEYEIFNLQTLPNYEIVGGYQKLLNYFKNKYKPKSLCIYVDIAKHNRKEFKDLGFKYRKTIKPKLWIYENKIRKQVYDNYKDINPDWLPVPDCGYYLMYYPI